MIMRTRIGDSEANRYEIEERRIGERSTVAAKIIRDVKGQLEFAGAHGVIGQQRLIGSSFGVGVQRLDQSRSASVDPREVDAHSGSRPAVGGVEHVGRELAHGAIDRIRVGLADQCNVQSGPCRSSQAPRRVSTMSALLVQHPQVLLDGNQSGAIA